jgi:hypothetical protein
MNVPNIRRAAVIWHLARPVANLMPAGVAVAIVVTAAAAIRLMWRRGKDVSAP